MNGQPDPFGDWHEGPRYLRRYLEAAERSSSRTRWSTIVLAIASVLCFIAAWNVEEFGWLRNRREVIHRAREYSAAGESARLALLTHESESERQLYRRASDWLKSNNLKSDRDLVRIPIAFARVTKSDSARAAPDTIEASLTVDLDAVALELMAGNIERAWVESFVVLDVPFLGISFDVNDLGLIAGLAFTIVLLMRKLSLDSERHNLRRLFRVGYRANRLRTTYELICMGQIWTVPRRDFGVNDERLRAPGGNWSALFWPRIVPPLLNVAPPVLLLWIYVTNRRSASVGFITSAEATTLSLSASLLFLIFVVALTGLCLYSEFAITKLFDDVSGPNEAVRRRALGLPPEEGTH